jgi:hypothetical protein
VSFEDIHGLLVAFDFFSGLRELLLEELYLFAVLLCLLAQFLLHAAIGFVQRCLCL